ncbi:hypothetical protein [Sphingomonas sp. DT-204]
MTRTVELVVGTYAAQGGAGLVPVTYDPAAEERFPPGLYARQQQAA